MSGTLQLEINTSSKCLSFSSGVLDRNGELSVDSPHQFCSDIDLVEHVYLAISLLSAISCMLVFLTYVTLPRLRHGGHSTVVFIYR